MQRQLDRVKEELKETVVEGTAGGGLVRVHVTGDRRVEKIEIDDSVVEAADREALEDLVLAALRDGLGRAEQLAQDAMGRVTGGVNLPGLG